MQAKGGRGGAETKMFDNTKRNDGQQSMQSKRSELKMKTIKLGRLH